MPNDREETLRYWADQFNSWKASGLRRRAYCEREGLRLTAFVYWQQQLRLKSTDAQSDDPKTAPLTLIPAHIASPDLPQIVLRHPSGWQMIFPTEIDAAWLANVMRGLP
jgi:hypothetical protein